MTTSTSVALGVGINFGAKEATTTIAVVEETIVLRGEKTGQIDEGLCGIQGVRIIEILIATEGTAEEDIMIK